MYSLNSSAPLATCAGFTASAREIPIRSQKIYVPGFGSQGFLYSSDYNYLGKTSAGSFGFTELGLSASPSPFNRTRIAVQGFASGTGKVGNLEPFLNYALVECTSSDAFGIRAGRVRRPGSICNHIQDVDLARTFVLLPQGLHDSRWRDFSTSVDGGLNFGNLSLGKAGSLPHEAVSGSVNLSDGGGVGQWIMDGSAATFLGFNKPLSSGGQLWWNPLVSGLRTGLCSGYTSNFGFDLIDPVSPVGPAGPINAFVHASAEVLLQQYLVEYTRKKWTLQAEYFTRRYRRYNTVNVLSVRCRWPRPPLARPRPSRTAGMSARPTGSTTGWKSARIAQNTTPTRTSGPTAPTPR
jgi:hypothetical protein